MKTKVFQIFNKNNLVFKNRKFKVEKSKFYNKFS